MDFGWISNGFRMDGFLNGFWMDLDGLGWIWDGFWMVLDFGWMFDEFCMV